LHLVITYTISQSVNNKTYLIISDCKRAMTMCLNSAGEMLPAHLSDSTRVWRRCRPMALTARPRPTVFSLLLFSFPLIFPFEICQLVVTGGKLLLTSVTRSTRSLSLIYYSPHSCISRFLFSFAYHKSLLIFQSAI